MSDKADLMGLRYLALELASDKSITQGPGGNISIKLSDVLWVKASGTWLLHANEKDIFVPLDLARATELVAQQATDQIFTALRSDLASSDARPSIEAALHALMPHRVVAHIHSVNTATHAILKDGCERVASALADVPWVWIDYHRPGAPLAQAVSSQLTNGGGDVLLLQNHGLVVGGETVEEVLAMVRDIERRLDLAPRARRPVRPVAAPSADFEWVEHWSDLADDSTLLSAFSKGALFPDQVVFLGGRLPLCAPGETLDQAADRVRAASGIDPALVILPGTGAFGRIDRNPSAESQIDWMADIARRIPQSAPLNYLSAADTAELLDWDAEKYRRRLNRA